MFPCDSLGFQGLQANVAKHTVQSAGAYEAENTGGILSGFFAEENEFDRRSMWRIGSWGVTAVAAVVLAVVANQSQLGWRREQVAAVDLARQAQQIQSLAKESQTETRRLASAVDTLNSDRDRLFSRVTVVEQGLDSVTGAIARQNVAVAAPPKPPPSVAPPPATMMAPSAAADPPPQPGPVQSQAAPATIAAAPAPEKPRAEAVKPDPAPALAALLPPIPSSRPAVPLGAIPQASAAPTAALGATKSIMGPPDPAAPKLVEPAKETAKTANSAPAAAPALAPVQEVATAAPTDAKDNAKDLQAKDQQAKDVQTKDLQKDLQTKDLPKDQDKPVASTEAANNTIQRTEFAVDLGGANSIGGLRALWRGLLKSNNPELAELRPIIVLRESNTGLGMQLRLAAGPLNDAAEAAKICASLVENKRSCETTVFDGQRLAVSADDPMPPVASKPPTQSRQQSYRRYSPRHSKREEPAPAPAPAKPSAFSSLFGSKR
jgi:hypothetical protein